MEILSQTPQFRTKCMALSQAARFAKCLEANPRFVGVAITESKRAKSDKKWFVAFTPSNPERVQALLDRQQAARAQRAAEQSFTFLNFAGFARGICRLFPAVTPFSCGLALGGLQDCHVARVGRDLEGLGRRGGIPSTGSRRCLSYLLFPSSRKNGDDDRAASAIRPHRARRHPRRLTQEPLALPVK